MLFRSVRVQMRMWSTDMKNGCIKVLWSETINDIYSRNNNGECMYKTYQPELNETITE